jgi:hypothetical protein
LVRSSSLEGVALSLTTQNANSKKGSSD